MEPTIALTTPCSPAFSWVLDLAHDQTGPPALDVRLEDISGGRVHSLIERASFGCAVPAQLRFHFPLGGIESAQCHPSDLSCGLSGALEAIDALPGTGNRILTVHLPLPSDCSATDFADARSRLAEVVAHGRAANVSVCLENLRWGVTSDPDRFIDLVESSDAAVTFDIGHANSSDVASAGFSAERFARLVSDRVRNAHIYDREDPHHVAPHDLDRIGPVLDILLESQCDWWVIELFDRDEVIATREMLGGFLADRYRLPQAAGQ